jgi:hypothetical protein
MNLTNRMSATLLATVFAVGLHKPCLGKAPVPTTMIIDIDQGLYYARDGGRLDKICDRSRAHTPDDAGTELPDLGSRW